MEGNEGYMSERIEEDMDNRILFYNASSIATHLLLEVLSKRDESESNEFEGRVAPTPNSLHKKLLSKFNVGGY